VLAAAAAVAFLASVMLAVRTGDSAPTTRTEVLGARASRQSVTSSPSDALGASKSTGSSKSSSTTASTETTLTLETIPAGPVTSLATTSTTDATGRSTTTTVVSQSTTTTAVSAQDVTEESDNTATYVYNESGSGGSSATADTQPSNDPLTFLVQAAWDHDNVADLNAKIDNNTARTITFPGDNGFVLRFLIDRDGQPWRTVEIRRSDIRSLPPHAEMLVTGNVYMEKYGTYTVGGEVPVRYS
jgi:hypothetical protein